MFWEHLAQHFRSSYILSYLLLFELTQEGLRLLPTSATVGLTEAVALCWPVLSFGAIATDALTHHALYAPTASQARARNSTLSSPSILVFFSLNSRWFSFLVSCSRFVSLDSRFSSFFSSSRFVLVFKSAKTEYN